MDEDEYREPHAGDDPVAAFDRLRGEVSLLRVAIEGLAAARESIEIPDYEPTLARTERILTVLTEQLEPIAESPALTLTPHRMASEIATAATAARREDQRLLTEARTAFDQATRQIGNQLASARRGDEQNRWLYIAGMGGLVLGLLFYAVLAGPIVRLTPDSWLWPEGMATRALGSDSQWDAGQRLMRTASPESWNGIVMAANLARDNRDAIEACRKSATKAKKPVRCTVEVKALGE